MSDFPTLGNKEDIKKFGYEVEDVGMRSSMDGGYVLTRPRHTRRPRRTWSTGFTFITDSEKNTFETFFNNYGTYKAFTYTVKTNSEVVNVRFASKPEFKFTGFGSSYRWDIDVKLEEV